MQFPCSMLSSMACPALQYFSTLSHNRTIFEKRKLLNIKCVFLFSVQLLSETFPILRRNELDMTVNVYWYACKVPGLLSAFNEP